MGGKRKLEVTDDVNEEKEEKKKSKQEEIDFRKLHQSLTKEGTLSIEDLEKLRDFLVDNKDNESVKLEVKKLFNLPLLTSLMTTYTATMAHQDTVIYECLTLLERVYGVNMGQWAPLVFGEKSKSNYLKLRKMGTTLHVKLTPNQVLGFIDQKQAWGTVLYGNKPDHSTPERIYDSRFLLRLLASQMYPGSDISLYAIVKSTGLSLAFSCTSSRDIQERKIAYYVLQRFVTLMQELRVDTFEQKPLFVYLIRLFKNSIEHEAQHIPNVVSQYLARIAKVIVNPENAMFSRVMRYITLDEPLNMKQVPDLMCLLFSSSTDQHNSEREFMLRLMAESCHEPNDYNILQNRSVIKIVLSLFSSPLSNKYHKTAILALLKRCSSMPSVCHDLVHKMNLHTWIAFQMTKRGVSIFEKGILGEIFMNLVECERKNVRIGKKVNVASVTTINMAANIVVNQLRTSENEQDVEFANKIETIVQRKWKVKKDIVKAEE